MNPNTPFKLAGIALACGMTWSWTAAADAGLADSQHVAPAWRGEANTTHFGWDVLEFPVPVENGQSGGILLDDTTPDFGDSVSGARFQQVGEVYGHISSTNNYYSGFAPGMTANDIITAPTGSGTGGGSGLTTVIFQMTAQDLGGGPAGTGGTADASEFDIEDITLNGLAADPANFAEGVNSNGVSQWFAQWVIAGDPESVQIAFSNNVVHTSLDLWEVDIAWSPDAGRAIATPAIVPEPASVVGVALGAVVIGMRRRRRG